MAKISTWKSSRKTIYKPKKTTSKYNNQKVVYEGIKFDSKKELKRYIELKLLLKAGEISNLELQKRFPLIDKSENGREIAYIADFTYKNKLDQLVVEDVKSPATRTPLYKLKKRLMAERYGIEIVEI